MSVAGIHNCSCPWWSCPAAGGAASAAVRAICVIGKDVPAAGRDVLPLVELFLQLRRCPAADVAVPAAGGAVLSTGGAVSAAHELCQ